MILALPARDVPRHGSGLLRVPALDRRSDRARVCPRQSGHWQPMASQPLRPLARGSQQQ